MSDEHDSQLGSDSRRSFVKKGALASGALALGLGSAGSAAAQEGAAVDAGGGNKGVIFVNAFQPAARFTFVSGVVEWNPNVPEVSDNMWTNYQTRMIRWLNTNEIVPFFVAQAADVGEFNEDLGFVVDADDDPQQPQLYEMNREYTLFGDNPALLTVNFSPVGEEQEDNILENDDWWQDAGGGGGGGGTPTGTPGGG